MARAARVQALLRGERLDVTSAEATLSYRLRQSHIGVVAWVTAGEGDALGELERAMAQVAADTCCDGRPLFVPHDESSAWGWLPLGGRRSLPAGGTIHWTGDAKTRVRFAFGAPGRGVSGFRRTHRQALSAQAVALAAGTAGQLVTSFTEVAPLALMSGSFELLHAWVIDTLGALAADDPHHARLRTTLTVFLAENGSYKAAAERLTLHKNTVQYRCARPRRAWAVRWARTG